MLEFFLSWPIALALLALLQAADVITTIGALKRGAREANPIIAWMMGKLGDYGWIFAKLLLAGVGAVLCFQGNLIWGIWIMCLIYAYVVRSNHKAAR